MSKKKYLTGKELVKEFLKIWDNEEIHKTEKIKNTTNYTFLPYTETCVSVNIGGVQN
jgi:hypothetical protein